MKLLLERDGAKNLMKLSHSIIDFSKRKRHFVNAAHEIAHVNVKQEHGKISSRILFWVQCRDTFESMF